MPVQPSRSQVHIDGPLTQISLAFFQNAENFVADRVFPDIPVSKQSDAYFTIPRGDFNRDEMRRKAPGARPAMGGYDVGNDTYQCDVFAFGHPIPDEVRANADDPLDLDRQGSEFVSHKALIQREVSWAAGFLPAGTNPGNIWSFALDGAASRSASLDPSDGTGTNNDVIFWNRTASTPIEDVRLGKRTVQASTGYRPNVMTIGRPAYDVLLDHPDIVGRLDRGQTPGGPAMAKRDALAALFELDEILVMDGIVNTAAKGATAAHSFISGNHALLTYRPQNPGILVPSAGYTFTWTGFVGGGATNAGTRIRTKRMDLEDSDLVQIDSAYDHKLVAGDLGFFFDGIVE